MIASINTHRTHDPNESYWLFIMLHFFILQFNQTPSSDTEMVPVLLKRENIVKIFEIGLKNIMFDSFLHSQNIVRQKFLACLRKWSFLKTFLSNSAYQAMFCDVEKRTHEHCSQSKFWMFDKLCFTFGQGLIASWKILVIATHHKQNMEV